MARFGEVLTDLRLIVMENLSDRTLQTVINRAHAQILEAWNWSFLNTNTVINSVAPKQAGTITVSQGSPNVVGDGTAWGREDVGAFLWAGGLETAPYPIQDVAGTAALSLSNPWSGPTTTFVSYVIAPLYYLVEDALEVLAVRQIVDLEFRPREWVNAQDPARIAQGAAPSWIWTSAPASPDGSVQIELWPVPADTRPYLVEYKRRAPILSDENDQFLCPSTVVEARAARRACKMMYASTGQASWAKLADDYQTEYFDELEKAQHEDSRRIMDRSQVTAPELSQVYAKDSLFLPTHDLD